MELPSSDTMRVSSIGTWTVRPMSSTTLRVSWAVAETVSITQARIEASKYFIALSSLQKGKAGEGEDRP